MSEAYDALQRRYFETTNGVSKFCPLRLIAQAVDRTQPVSATDTLHVQSAMCVKEDCGWWAEAAECCALAQPPVYVLHDGPATRVTRGPDWGGSR